MLDPDPYDDPRDRPGAGMRLVSLYSGAGGLDDGFIRAGFEPIWANDFDPMAVESYNANIPGEHAVAGRIEDRRGSLPASADVDVVVGGPPCQGFSVAGRMDPNDPRSQHIWTFMDIVEHLEPDAFVMENVKALAVNNRWKPLIDRLLERASHLGYQAHLFVLNAAHYRVPQSRERMFLIGIRGTAPRRPAPTTEQSPITVRQALATLPGLGEPGNDQACPAIITAAKKPVMRRSPHAGLLFNGKGRALNLDAPALTLPASMGGNRTPIIDQAHLAGESEWIVEYHARLARGGEPVKRVPASLRRLTVEEAAALQTFRVGWEFCGPQSARFRQIGNAVPPRLAYAVAMQLGNQLRELRLTCAEPQLAAA